MEQTKIQEQIESIVTNELGFEKIKVSRHDDKTALNTTLKYMDSIIQSGRDKKWEIFLLEVDDRLRCEKQMIEDMNSDKKSSPFNGLVPIGFTAERLYSGKTKYISKDNSNYFIR
jgi:thioester reductase-like protein